MITSRRHITITDWLLMPWFALPCLLFITPLIFWCLRHACYAFLRSDAFFLLLQLIFDAPLRILLLRQLFASLLMLTPLWRHAALTPWCALIIAYFAIFFYISFHIFAIVFATPYYALLFFTLMPPPAAALLSFLRITVILAAGLFIISIDILFCLWFTCFFFSAFASSPTPFSIIAHILL